MGYAFTGCRVEGHSWHHKERLLGGIATGTVGLVSTCVNCGMERTRWIARSGKLQSPSYKAPEGYRTSGDARRTNQEWRREYVASIFDTPKGKR